MSGVTYHGSVKSKILVSFLFCGVVLCAHAQDAIKPAIDGYVTSITSAGNFDVNGLHVVAEPHAQFVLRVISKEEQSDTIDESLAGKLQVGDAAQIYGKADSAGVFHAAQVILPQTPPTPIQGTAVIQLVNPSATDMILEADGYQIIVNSTTKISYGAHIQKGDIAPGMWVHYIGSWDAQGRIHANEAKVTQFALTSRDKKLRKVHVGDNITSAKVDAKLQERIQKVGEKLIPVFQKNLAATDPQKINFQFFVCDMDLLHVPEALQSGTIVLSKRVVGFLQNDDQIAAVLANGMAQILEWQYPYYDGVQLSGKGQAQALAVGFFAPLPIAALAPIPYDSTINWNTPLSPSGKEKARVALSLMHDAGFDIRQAPAAWQHIGAQYPKPSKSKALPQPSIYMIRILAKEYHAYGENSSVENVPASKN